MSADSVFRWVLDVEPLWPCPRDGGQRVLTKQLWATSDAFQTALDLLPLDEQAKVLRFHFASDAKLCLGSCLLKRKAISKACQVGWSDIVIGQDSNKKPCYKPADATGKALEFNVSHHGSLVALVACLGNGTQLGVDVVKMNFEKDYAMVVKDGFSVWARTYEMVFSDREMSNISDYQIETASGGREEIVRAKLRHFYAHWCLKEAYVKMTGEALLAPWLKELEFRNVLTPVSASCQDREEDAWGQTCRDVEIWFRGSQLTDVSLEIQAFGEDYMIATSASNRLAKLSSFRELSLEEDIYSKVL